MNLLPILHKQDYKSKLITEKYSLLPINRQQLTPAQTALQRLSEKHPHLKIQLRSPYSSLNMDLAGCCLLAVAICCSGCNMNYVGECCESVP